MIPPVLRSRGLVTLVGGAPVAPDDLNWALSVAPRIAAADSGAATAIGAGHDPLAVIGDLDSLPDPMRNRIDPARLHHVPEQDSTDFEKCLQRIDAPGIIGLGFLGARIDHSLAALSCLVRRAAPCLLVGPEDIAFAAPAHLALDLPEGTRVSLFPFGEVIGRSTGLRWPIDGLRLSPMGRIGTSNVALGPVTLSAPGLCVLLPKDMRDRVIPTLFPS